MLLNSDHNIKATHNVILYSLADAHEILPRISIWKKMCPWNDNSELKRLILEIDKQKRKENGWENTKQLTNILK